METPQRCRCDGPPVGHSSFWCPRHRVQKSRQWWLLCLRRDDYYRAWEEGRGPGQAKPGSDPPREVRTARRPCSKRPELRPLASLPQAALAARLGVCRACPEHHRIDAVREFCGRDLVRNERGEPCLAAALRAWARRLFGQAACEAWREAR